MFRVEQIKTRVKVKRDSIFIFEAKKIKNFYIFAGDSGGPLMMDDNTSEGRFTLIGLVSFGPRTCGVSNFAGVYTRISAYINWIMKHIRL